MADPSVIEHYEWLEEKLEQYSNSKDVAWLGFVGHHPPLIEASLKEDFIPLIQKYKIDFALVGHKHQFEYANFGYEDQLRFPGKDRGGVLDDCKKKTKEILNSDSRTHTFKKGEKFHQFMIGGSGRKMKKICPYKDQDGEVYIQNVQKHGLATVEVDSKHFNVRYHNADDLSEFFEVTISQ